MYKRQIVSVFKFDASSLVSEAQIREATLRLYVSDTKQDSADFAVWSTSGATSWTEETVTWNNGPTKKDKLSATCVTANNNWYEWDVTEYMDAVLKTSASSLASVTFWLEGDEWTGASTGVAFDSHERTNHPELRVTGSDTRVPETATAVVSSSCPENTTPAGAGPSDGDGVEEGVEEAAVWLKETGDGGVLAAVVILFVVLVYFVALNVWQHALLNPEGCSARCCVTLIGAERFRSARDALRTWRRCSCFRGAAEAPTAAEPEEEPRRRRRGLFGLFRVRRGAEREAEEVKEKGQEATGENRRGGGLFGWARV